ncbi:SDR family NAD(P)-dependent oxidoreductase [Amycolatopsis sp. GM8]|uniref:SDR family NAD(P)-dependent oxidoreductase n=1 Tax=Amycolatopsis sp. GM8 TaxID=2896530 RepID=UPI001F483B0D|nr:SDR family NAD(P)-dependent oxidoreductase [Amycolatopsis sp. GM8]
MGRLDGKTAIVTGAGRGLGRVYALRLASLGADVAVVDKSLTSFKEFQAEADLMTAGSTVEEIENLGRRALGFEFDVADRAAQEAMARAVFEAWGRIDILVANAGGGSSTPMATRASDLPTKDLELVIERNLYGTIFSVNAVAPYMKQARAGKIVTISSGSGGQADPAGSYAHYGTAKAAIAMYTRYLAQDVGEYGIRANCLAPGYTDTGRLLQLSANAPGTAHQNALRRHGTPEELANVVEFLTTDLSSFVTGAVIQADGGTVLGAV